MFMYLLIACPAERLGVELPERGGASISQEDLQRDVFALTREPPEVVFRRRMEQMHVDEVVVTSDALCARKDGRDPSPRLVRAEWPDTLGGRVGTAALVSIAKGWDGPEDPPRSVWLCAARAGARLPVDPASGDLVVVADVVPTAATGNDLPGGHGAVDWRVVQSDVAGLFAWLDQ
jgi:hypothetical protein